MSATTPERGRRGGATLTVEEVAGAAVLRVGGELDLLTVPDLQARVYEAIGRRAARSSPTSPRCSSSARPGSPSCSACSPTWPRAAVRSGWSSAGARAVSRPLLITGLDRFLELHPDLDAALAACHP
jgi:hypothetical protein